MASVGGCDHMKARLRSDHKKTEGTRCSNCRRIAPNYDIINLGSIESGYRILCGQCFNAESAKLGGLDKFEHLNFEPVRMVDCEGQAHDFHFRTHLFLPGVALNAFELRDGEPAGYQFQIIGDPERISSLCSEGWSRRSAGLCQSSISSTATSDCRLPTRLFAAGLNGMRTKMVGCRSSLLMAGRSRGTNSATC